MGIGGGKDGGNIIYEGNIEGLLESGTLHGNYLKRKNQLKPQYRNGNVYLTLNNVSFHNLNNVSVKIP